jgi:hypothetical protein
MSPLNPVLLFDESGKLVRSFGAGMMAFPHGIHVDRVGTMPVTATTAGRTRRAAPAVAEQPVVGQQRAVVLPQVAARPVRKQAEAAVVRLQQLLRQARQSDTRCSSSVPKARSC